MTRSRWILTRHIQHFGVGAIPWSPLARGALTRPLEKQEQPKTQRETSDMWVIALTCNVAHMLLSQDAPQHIYTVRRQSDNC